MYLGMSRVVPGQAMAVLDIPLLQVLLSWVESEILMLIQHIRRGRSAQRGELSESVVSFHSFLIFFVKNFLRIIGH